VSTWRESSLTGAGGLRIYWQSWLPEGPPHAVIVLAHGYGEHSGRYPHVAVRFADEGFAVYALDHRGHGRSEGRRPIIDRMDHAVADLDSLVRIAAGEHPDPKPFLLGHSMGGCIAVSYAMRHQDRLDGLILTSPLAALEAASPVVRMVAKALSALAPRLPVTEIDASLISRDPEVVKDYEADPLVHHGKMPARTAAEMVATVESFPDGVPEIRIPVLIMYGTADGLCPPEGSLMLNRRIGSPDETLKPYEGLYHEILNEPEKDRVMDDICAWVEGHTPVTPAGAGDSAVA
jgi:acylglycerol lipase